MLLEKRELSEKRDSQVVITSDIGSHIIRVYEMRSF